MSHEFVQCLIIHDRKGYLTLAEDPGREGGCAATWREIKAVSFLPEAYRREHPKVVKLFKEKGIHVAVNGDEVRQAREGCFTKIAGCLLDGSTAATVDPLKMMYTRLQHSMEYFCKEQDIRAEVVAMTTDAAHTLPAVDDTNRDVFRQCVRFKLYSVGSLLHELIRREFEVLARMALDDGADVHAPNFNGETPLHLAAEVGSVTLVKLLVQRGARLDVTDGDMYTLLHTACKWNPKKEVLEFLLDNGCQIDAKNSEGATPLHLLAEQYKGNDDLLLSIQLLLARGATLDSMNGDSATPLFCAARPDVVKFLLENGADLNITTWEGKTPIFFQRSVECAEVLIDHGADVYKTCWGMSILNNYFEYRNPEVLEYVLQRCFFSPYLSKNPGILNDICIWQSNECSQIFASHLVRLTALKPDSSHGYDVTQYWQNAEVTIASFQEECEAEVARMRSQSVTGTALSVFDILTKDECSLAHLLANPSVVLDIDKLKEEFPIYGNILTYRIKGGRNRKLRQEEAIDGFKRLSIHFRKIPDEVKETIMSRLSIFDLVNLKKASALFAAEK